MTSDKHPNGYTKEMIKELLGTAWLDKNNIPETGNQIRRRKGQEMRAGTRPYPKYPSKESRIADTSGMFDENGQYIYPEGSCLLYTSPSPRDRTRSRMPSSA